MLMAEVGLFEAIYSQRQFTHYKPNPVPAEALEKIVDAATKAPSGANRQPWEFIVITDRDLIGQVGRIYRDVWLAAWAETPTPGESAAHGQARYLAQHMPEVPAMILVCADHGTASGGEIVRGSQGSSIWLAVQNLFLAARALGLGTRLTTAHLRGEQEIKNLLGIPDHVETVTLIPVGYPEGEFGVTKRRPAAEVTSYNRYGNRRAGDRGERS
ncbi:MAG TPA: nitroreductase family protein [Dehalococcoidia bacterium]|nr:nitroreductase family protein [Dehalococcoidia bacterium]